MSHEYPKSTNRTYPVQPRTTTSLTVLTDHSLILASRLCSSGDLEGFMLKKCYTLYAQADFIVILFVLHIAAFMCRH